MKTSHISDLNVTAFLIAACFAHGFNACLLGFMALLELMRYASLRKRGQ